MGMPGSETALEEIMCRVLGDLLQEGIVAKLADDPKRYSKTGREYSRHVTGVIRDYQHQKHDHHRLDHLAGSGVPVVSVLVNTASIL